MEDIYEDFDTDNSDSVVLDKELDWKWDDVDFLDEPIFTTTANPAVDAAFSPSICDAVSRYFHSGTLDG